MWVIYAGYMSNMRRILCNLCNLAIQATETNKCDLIWFVWSCCSQPSRVQSPETGSAPMHALDVLSTWMPLPLFSVARLCFPPEWHVLLKTTRWHSQADQCLSRPLPFNRPRGRMIFYSLGGMGGPAKIVQSALRSSFLCLVVVQVVRPISG